MESKLFSVLTLDEEVSLSGGGDTVIGGAGGPGGKGGDGGKFGDGGKGGDGGAGGDAINDSFNKVIIVKKKRRHGGH